MSKKMGRPTDNPKDSAKLTVRLDKETNTILNDYCNKMKINKAEGIRRGIKLLKEK